MILPSIAAIAGASRGEDNGAPRSHTPSVGLNTCVLLRALRASSQPPTRYKYPLSTAAAAQRRVAGSGGAHRHAPSWKASTERRKPEPAALAASALMVAPLVAPLVVALVVALVVILLLALVLALGWLWMGAVGGASLFNSASASTWLATLLKFSSGCAARPPIA
eukprot:6188145-Pleurochrysis_carterae.AAC.1